MGSARPRARGIGSACGTHCLRRRRAEPIASRRMTLEAVVFDFDGLIIDSEWVIYESAAAAFAAPRPRAPVEAWATVVGTNGERRRGGGGTALCARGSAIDFDVADYNAAYEAQDRSNRDALPPLPGVVELLDALVGRADPASASPPRRAGPGSSATSAGWARRPLQRCSSGATSSAGSASRRPTCTCGPAPTSAPIRPAPSPSRTPSTASRPPRPPAWPPWPCPVPSPAPRLQRRADLVVAIAAATSRSPTSPALWSTLGPRRPRRP